MISKLVARVEMAKSEERESQLAQRTECFVWLVVLMIIFSMMNILTMRGRGDLDDRRKREDDADYDYDDDHEDGNRHWISWVSI